LRLAFTALLLTGVAFGFGLTGPFAIALGLAVWVMARRDLALMRARLMDPVGQEETADARALAFVAVVFSLFMTAAWGALLVKVVVLGL
jgi:hypothetical protein